MKKKRVFNYLCLILIMILSFVGFVYFSFPLLETSKINIKNGLIALVSIITFVISSAIIIGVAISNKQRKVEASLKNRLEMWNSISYKVKKAGETAFNHLPIGILIINNRNKILWSNNYAKEIFKSPLENFNLKNISSELYNSLEHDLDEFNTEIYGEIYHIKYIRDNNIVYLTNITDFNRLQTLYDNRITAVGYVNIDNLEDALSEFDVQERAEYSGKIIGMIAKWFEKYGAYVRAFTDNKYLLVMDHQQLEQMMKTSFPLLDEIKTIMHNSKPLRVTLSIGIACMDIPIMDLSEEALNLLDLTLNRGGDQVAVKVNDKITYYGAKQEAIPKDNKVDIRIKSEELQDLFNSSSSIFVMAHKDTDTDGFGGALALYKMARSLGKTAYIVEETVDQTVTKIINDIKKDYIELEHDIITPSKAISLADDKSLLMIVDFQTVYQAPESKPEGNETESDSLPSHDAKIIKKFKNIAIIDHHRKGAGAIENHKFYYSKTYASSSVEIIMELLEFWKKPVEFSSVEATWLLLGIIVDTNNFIYRANAKTFEVSATLKKYGADMTLAQRYLKEGLDEIYKRNDFTKNIMFHNDDVAITCASDTSKYERAEIAKISDALLDIENVELGITIAYLEDGSVGVSARSLGLVNAQTIMEKLGGGGHLNNAAAQIKNSTIEEVKERLIKILDETLNAEKKQKIIFLKDIKARGKKYEIKEIEYDIAMKLIDDGSAIIASTENLKMIDNKKNQDKIEKEKTRLKLTELKNLIESRPVKLLAKVDNGQVKVPVNEKQISDGILKEFGRKIDTKKIELVDSIKDLGTFTIPISLNKEITANVTLYITEE